MILVPILDTAGLLINLAGVILLFRFAMPFKMRTGGAVHYVGENLDHKVLAREKRDDCISHAGMTLVVIGTFLQILSAWI